MGQRGEDFVKKKNLCVDGSPVLTGGVTPDLLIFILCSNTTEWPPRPRRPGLNRELSILSICLQILLLNELVLKTL